MRHFLGDAFFKERRKLTAEAKSAPTTYIPHIGQRQYLTNWITFIPHHQQAVGKDDISVISSTPCCKLYLWQPSWLRGAGGRLWTPDLMLTKHLLYQLSYTSIYGGAGKIPTCGSFDTMDFKSTPLWALRYSTIFTGLRNFTIYKWTQRIPCIFLPL